MKDRFYRRDIKYLLLILPALLLYFFSLVGPLLIGTIPSSFYNWNIINGNHDFIGMDNFIRLFGEKAFLNSILFTGKLALATIIGTNIFGFITAYFLSEDIFAKDVSRSLFFIPYIISGIMIAFVWMFIFTGVIPSLGKVLRIEELSSIGWFGTPAMAVLAIIIVTIWHNSGFSMILFVAGLQTISKEIIEAAKIDGCTGLNKIFRIQLPLLMPAITINLFLSISGAFKAFDIPLALTQGGPARSTQTIALNIYNDAFGSFRMGYASAKSVVLFLIISLITVIQLIITRKREIEA
jgi:raffinose/stachyose/melibiose transport system permease protein